MPSGSDEKAGLEKAWKAIRTIRGGSDEKAGLEKAWKSH